MRFQGKVTEWRDEQGFGFVTQNGDGKRIFLHIKSFSRRGRRPVLNDSVTYAVAIDAKGRAAAEQVAFAGERQEKKQAVRGPDSALPLWFAALFAIIILVLLVLGVFHWYVLAFYAALNLFTFVRYWLDKEAARKDEHRTPEDSLHLLALLGGWPGALLAQRMFRHKSSKRSFQQTYWTTVVLHCVGLVVLLWLLKHGIS